MTQASFDDEKSYQLHAETAINDEVETNVARVLQHFQGSEISPQEESAVLRRIDLNLLPLMYFV